MKKYVPFEKLSKKEKKKINDQKRTLWSVNPVTRKPENSRAYNRNKARKIDYDSYSSALVSKEGTLKYQCFGCIVL